MVDKLCTGIMRKLFLILYILCILCGLGQSKDSFMIKFQDSGSLSNSEWAEFSGAIPHLKDFTVCHWDKLQFFNMKSHSVWNYCTIMSMESSMDCMKLW